MAKSPCKNLDKTLSIINLAEVCCKLQVYQTHFKTTKSLKYLKNCKYTCVILYLKYMCMLTKNQ